MLAQCRGYELTKVTTADPLFSCEKRDQTDGVNFVAISPLTFHSDTIKKRKSTNNEATESGKVFIWDPGVPVTSLFFTYSGPKHWFCRQISEDNGTQANKNIRKCYFN